MVSPIVAAEIGSWMGIVEEVEKRKNQDDQNLFMRVRVALPISKPIQRGVFVVSSEGHRMWCKVKYERLPMFCHLCGILGHDLRHCAAYFAAVKKDGEV